MITQQELLDRFEYRNGELIRKINNKPMKGMSNSGYLRANINGTIYLVHRLIFMMHYGYLPKYIDHIDGNTVNNNIVNLRDASLSENAWNRRINKNSVTKVKGVRLHNCGKYQVRLQVNKKSMNFGLYNDLELAELVATEARNKYHKEFANHGY
jgi:hypothetical protein